METMNAVSTPQDSLALQQLIADVFDNIWSGGDTAQVRKYQLDDFVILEHGEVWTNDTIRQWQLGRFAEVAEDEPQRKNSFEFFRTEVLGDEAWLAYHNRAHWVNQEGDTTGTFSWLESAVAKRTPAGWKLSMMHSTRVGR